jgi:hypothetical protein
MLMRWYRAPTSGGQYHWVSEFAPKKHQKFLSYVVGSSKSSLELHKLQKLNTNFIRLAMRSWLANGDRIHCLPRRRTDPRSNHPQ